MNDFEWIEKKTDGGHTDTMDCSWGLGDLLQKADGFVAGSDGSWSSFNITRKELTDTGWVFDLNRNKFPDYRTMMSNTADQNQTTWDLIVDWFERFDYERSERSEKDTKVKLSDGLRWGFWRRSRGNYCGLDGIGEEGFTVQTYVPKGSPTPIWGTRHGYNKKEIPTVKFKLWAFEQTGLTYFVGTGSFCEIDAVSKVPSYPSSISDQDWGARSLMPLTDDEQYQRPLDLQRQQDISTFVDQKDNRILNSIMVYLPQSAVDSGKASLREVKGGSWELEIDLSSFLVMGERGLMWDHDDEFDLRPLLIQDGQHRVRGGAISPTGQHKRVPLVVLPPEMSLADAARTFTEINTGSEELKALQKLHLRHRFNLPHMKKDLDFRDYREMPEGDSRRPVCRANRLGYEMASLLCADEDSALHGRIRMMDAGSGAAPVCMQATKFTKLASSWFRPRSIFGKEEIE